MRHKSLFLSLVALFLVYSCAQIGSISGGEKDSAAPKVVYSSVLNGQTNVQTNRLEILFDERIELNKPYQSAFISPQDVTLQFEKKNKLLIISWEDTLQKNTTYSIHLNGTIKDFHEGNDSLYQFVFSTGNKIDSAQGYFRIKDAYNGQLLEKATVGLYKNVEDSVPRYFGRTNRNGEVRILAVKPGSYYVRSFEDKNKNLFNDKIEPQATLFSKIEIKSEVSDTFVLLHSIPEKNERFPRITFIGPSLLSIANIEWSQSNGLNILNEELDWQVRHAVTQDSQLVFIPQNMDSISWVFQNDTSVIRISKRDKGKPVSLLYEEEDFGNSDSIWIRCSDFIDSLDFSKINLLHANLSDTIGVKGSVEKTHLFLHRPPQVNGSVKLLIEKGAIIGKSGNTNESFEVVFMLREEKELGTLILTREEEDPIVLQLLKNGKEICEQHGRAQAFNFKNLLPGSYQIRIIEDVNENGKWDSLDLTSKKQPEKTRVSTLSINVRANWEIKKEIKTFFVK